MGELAVAEGPRIAAHPDLIGHPALVVPLEAIALPALVGEGDGEEDEAVQGAGEDEGEEGAEVVDLCAHVMTRT
jgi:hypothetical protein